MRRCEICGAYLDAGEKCDCIEEKMRQHEKMKDIIKENNDGQMEMEMDKIWCVCTGRK